GRRAAARRDRERRPEDHRRARSHAGERAHHAPERRPPGPARLGARRRPRRHLAGGQPGRALAARADRLSRAPSRVAHPGKERRPAMTALVRPAFIRHAAAAAAVAAGCALGACASAPARFYTLESTAQPAAATAAAHDLAVIVGPVTVPAGVDRPEMVVQVAPNRVDVDEFNRWATPLGDAIARAVAVDLSVLLATPNVAAAPLANFAADDRVTIDVQRFESIPGDAALLDALCGPAAGGRSHAHRANGRARAGA